MPKELRQSVSAADLARIIEPPKTTIEYDSYHSGTLTERFNALYANIVTPSYAHGYSLGIEYMNSWFLKGFDKDYFKSVYIDGKHVIDDYKKFSRMNVKGENPRARIAPTVDYDFDRDGLDFYMGPPNIYLRRSRWQDSFFKDYENNLFLGFVPRVMKMNFNMKVRVNTRSQQLDVFNKMELNFRVGATMSEYISVDFHVPKSIVLNIANRAGFDIKNGEVVDIISFLHYLNRHSEVPFLFKLRAINQHPEYFIRIDELYVHVLNKDKLQLDDGERDGKLDFNFHVEMNPVLEMPVPYYYAFYSGESYKNNLVLDNVELETKPLYSINIIEIPKVDEHGWNQACITEYMCDEGETEMDISTLFSGNNVLNKAITHDLTVGVSPSKYINIKIYIDIDTRREVYYKIDWAKKIIHFEHPEKEQYLHIAIYIDRDYINELEVNLHGYNKNRVSISEEGQTMKTYKSPEEQEQVNKNHA